MRDIAGVIVPCLLTSANRNDPICVASPKVAKASTISVTVAGIFAGVIVLTFANGNIAFLCFEQLIFLRYQWVQLPCRYGNSLKNFFRKKTSPMLILLKL
jgi:hypothetical protein